MFNVSTGYKVLEVDQLLSVSKYLWTFDDLNDIKDLQGESWAQISGSLQTTTGVRGRAVKALGGAGFIELIKDAVLLLAHPLSHSYVTLSLWLSYEFQMSRKPFLLLVIKRTETGEYVFIRRMAAKKS